MRKLLVSLVAIGAALFATSCVNELEEGIQGNAGQVIFTVNAPELATRAYGDGTQATHLMYAVYDETAGGNVVVGVSNTEIGTEAEFTADATTGVHKYTTSVQIDLLDGNEYSVLFWAVNADYANAFVIDWAGKAMQMKGSIPGNSDSYDAFYSYVPTFKVEGAVTKSVTLTRPFAQLNYGSTDFNKAATLGFTPEQSVVTIAGAPDKLNCVNGEVSGNTTIVYTAATVPGGQLNGLTADYLAMNYVLVGEKKLYNTTLRVTGSGKAIENDYASVPMQRNYRTNVYGALLTNVSDFGVEVLPGFGGNENMEVVKVQAGTSQELQDAIDNAEEGKTTIIEITDDMDLSDLFGPAPVAAVTRAEKPADCGLYIPYGVEVVLNLNGKTLTHSKTQTTGYQMIKNDGDLTITDTKGNGKIVYTDLGNGGEYISNTITNRGTLTIEAGTVENASSEATADVGYCYAIDTSIWGEAPEVVVNITGGTVKSIYSPLRVKADRTTENVIANISGGNIYGRIDHQMSSSDAGVLGTLNISGGTFNVFGVKTEDVVMIFGAGLDSDASGIVMNVTGGVFNGKINVYRGAYVPLGKNFNEKFISGGQFNYDPSANVADGYEAVEADGMYEVVYSGCSTNANGEYVILDVAGLKWLAAEVNGGNTFSGKTVVLDADIDLKNEAWTPIGNVTNNFMGKFDGQNHTIKNLKIFVAEGKEGKAYMGFFGYAKNATIKNLTFENVDINVACLDIDHSQGHIGAVAGSLEGTSTIENVTVKGDVKVEATVSANGASRVAVVAGGNAYGNVTMKNVHVVANEGSYLMANNNLGALAGQLQGVCVFEDCSSNIDVIGTKFFAGGIIGISAGDSTFTNCHTTGNVTITAGRYGKAHDHYRVGGIAGGWADNVKTPCTLTNCTYSGAISGTNADGSIAKEFDYEGYVGRGYTLAGYQGSTVIIDGVKYVQKYNDAANAGIYDVYGESVNLVKNADQLVAALEEGKDVALLANVKIDPANMSNAYGTTGINIKNGQAIYGGGYTLDIKGAGGTWDSGINTTGGLIKDLTVTGSFRGIFINHNSTHSEKVVLENVTIDGTVYTISCDQGLNQGFEATNSTFNGWTSYAATLGNAKFTNCKFGEGSGYAFCRPYAPTEFVGCEFEAGFKMGAAAQVTFENCTLGGVALTAENLATLVIENTANASVK